VTSSPKSESRPRFSPDGKWLAFLSAREGKRTQVWLLPRCGGEAVKLTGFKTGVSDIVWSPDSKHLALVMKDADPDGAGSGDDEILAQVDFDGPDY
jgi:dipeptidyl aminopeptidase/acylaminoacyl peptidase